jgi:DNA repair exonuclease SbcCD ATPase subunit
VKVVEISAAESVIKISGDNGAGKSSVLDSIAYAIGGKKLIPDNPIRLGEDAAEIIVEVDDLIITRSFKRKDSGYTTTLKVSAKDGATYSAGQEVLDALLGKLSFDPFEFSRMDEKKQADILKGLVDLGIDLPAWEAEYKKLYEDRTIAGREADRLKATAQSMQKYDGVPDEETPASKIVREYEAGKAAHDAEQSRLDDVVDAAEKLWAANNLIDTLQIQLSDAKANKEAASLFFNELDSVVAPILPDLSEIKARMDSVEDTNSKIRANKERELAVERAKLAMSTHKKLDQEISAKLIEKDTAIKSAKYPVDGLMFDGDSLTYMGIPLSQASSGEKVILSAKIGMALNPKLKVLLIRDASLIGEKNYNALSGFAETEGYQLWLEYVDVTGEIGIYLEDGEVSK